MENNHHSRKRKHTHEHKSRQGESGKHHKHVHHTTAHERHARGHFLERLEENRQPLAIRDTNELSGDANYVRSWLAKTQDEDAVEPPKQSNPRTDHLEERASYSEYIHAARRLEEDKGDTTISKAKPNQERASSDSSLLEVSTAPVVLERTKPFRKSRVSSHLGENSTQSHKHRKDAPSTMTSSSSQSSVVQPKQETFEKRARHKTREDRYDTKQRSRKAEVVEKPIKMRREKKGDRKRAARKASEDLMNNFASNKLGQDRLTRPSNGPGIFQNGRASSPPRRRGLPDLAFSEMEFLQRSGKKSHIDNTIVVPKSRANEKRKATREQDEIATFFKPSKTPIRDSSLTLEHPTSPTSIHETSLHERQLRRNREHDRHRYYAENLISRISKIESHLAESRGQQLQPNQVQFPREPTPQLHSEEVGNRNIYSETADTIVTWSESQHSPVATGALRRAREAYCQRQNSATPDSVRSSIERTGIFKDTGIKSSSRRKSHVQEAISKELDGAGENRSVYTTGGPAETNRESSRLSTDSVKNPQQQNHLPQAPIHIQKETEELVSKRRSPDPLEIYDDGCRRVVVEYYDPNRGWYREEDSKSPSKPPKHSMEPAVAPISASLTRQQMALNARIKRPSTTLPVIREASNESRENSPLSNSGIPGEAIQRTESAPVRSSSVKGDMNGQIPMSHANGDERLEQIILGSPIPESTSSQIGQYLRHNQQHHWHQQTESTINIIRNGITQSEMSNETEKQPLLTRTAYLNDRARTPLARISHNSPNREHFQFHTRSPFRRGLRSYHEQPRQHIASTPRSPLIRLPSLYVQQLEHEQEQDQIANGLSIENVEECGASEVQGSDFNTEPHEEYWDDAATEQKMSHGVDDALENRRYVGDLGELGHREANMYNISLPGPETMGLRYENSGLDFQYDGYPSQDVRDEYNHWDSGNHYIQEPYIENHQDSQQQSGMHYHGNQLVQPLFPEYRELDEGQDGNASETILMQRFWRPNPQY
ncbi:hypothetical protein SBOR_3783 [Sclerotinia borealis F-4128]|uniref:Uncharacterized protein n=1 Tax=Sclerotinia borealis (strain F-4128) TaxID=1432307 RepID=W9CJ27_SCLBF|nr:hypothetical protein SBOR_3783 [Sclerotinia borealis F-4128]